MTPDGWRKMADAPSTSAEGYDHVSGAWCRRVSRDGRYWYVGTKSGHAVTMYFDSADEAKEYALGMVKP